VNVLDDRRARVSDLIALTRPLTARSVLASVLLGAREPVLPVADLVVAASLFGITPGAARTCLWRMVSNGELITDDATYTLAGHLLERRRRVDDASRLEHATASPWDGTWELAVVSVERRPVADRLELRKAAMALHLAEIREGVWTRPDNLDPDRLPMSRAVLDQQCTQFRRARSDITVDTARSLFPLATWAHAARRLIAAMDGELADGPAEEEAAKEVLTYQFVLSIAVVRHLQLDPVLPAALLPDDWPGRDLRRTYRGFDRAFKRRLNEALRQGRPRAG
jgi:phenylacetic acid degradation operon negative regulatory protein